MEFLLNKSSISSHNKETKLLLRKFINSGNFIIEGQYFTENSRSMS